MNADWHTFLDIAVLIASGFSAWNGLQLKLEVSQLKLWMIVNFEQRKKPLFSTGTNENS